jgi:hypothetical protein
MKVMAARGKEVDFAVWRLHHPKYSEVRRLALSDCGHAVTRAGPRATRMEIAVARSLPDAGNSKWGAPEIY